MRQLCHLIISPHTHPTIIHVGSLFDALQDFSFGALHPNTHHPDLLHPQRPWHDNKLNEDQTQPDKDPNNLSPFNTNQIPF
eukprot:6699271-Ditylum_brightwellii.AAC.1